jgi:hypothetical protein
MYKTLHGKLWNKKTNRLFTSSYSSKRLIWVYKVRLYSICGDNNRKAVWSHKSITPLASWNFWPLHCLFFDLRFLITLWYLESFDHYIVCSLSYAFWLPFGILKVLTITLFDLWFMLSDYPLVSSNAFWSWEFWPYNNRKAVWSHKSSISPVSFHWRQIIDVSCICALGGPI